MRVFKLSEGVQLRPLFFWDVVLCHQAVVAEMYKGKILHWTQKSEYLNLHVHSCKYLPLLLTYALFVLTVIVLCANCFFVFKLLYT
jgi:hypothetical protein